MGRYRAEDKRGRGTGNEDLITPLRSSGKRRLFRSSLPAGCPATFLRIGRKVGGNLPSAIPVFQITYWQIILDKNKKPRALGRRKEARIVTSSRGKKKEGGGSQPVKTQGACAFQGERGKEERGK